MRAYWNPISSIGRIVIVCLLLSLPAPSGSGAQEKTVFNTRFSKDRAVEDLDELARVLTTIHPHPFAFISSERFWRNVEEQKASLGAFVTYGELIWASSAIVGSLGCSHTTLGFFNQEDRALPIELRFPMDLMWIDGRMYVADPLANQGKVKAGAEIFSINDRDVRLLVEEIFPHIASQAGIETSRRHIFNAYSTSMIAYALGFPTSYEAVVKGRKAPIALTKLVRYSPRPRVDPEADCAETLCLRLLDEGKTGVLTIRSFAYYGEKFPIFESFVDESFRSLTSAGVDQLILDLRMNGGGPSDASLHLLRYLVDEPFAYFADGADLEHGKGVREPLSPGFHGELYILIDGNGTSSTGHFMSLVTEGGRVTTIGEELGSNGFCTANARPFTLSHSGIDLRVATNTFFTTAKENARNRGILPDHHIIQRIDAWLGRDDTVMRYALELVTQGRSTAALLPAASCGGGE